MSERGWLHRTGAVVGVLIAMLPWVARPHEVAAAAAKQEGVPAFRDQIGSAQALVTACMADSAACQADAVPADARVEAAKGLPGFNVNWEWLRDAVENASKASPQKRAETMRQAGAHLAELAQESGSARTNAWDAARFGRVRQTANRILAGGEFRSAEGPGWLDRQVARLQDWLSRVFMGMASMGARNPWIAPVIEWTFFGLAAGGLVFFIRRSLARQTLRIALGEAALAARKSDRDATDWARLAEEHAAARAWREALHCLYWAAIVSLEARNAWRPNPTRTPREYVRLLRPGSEVQRQLRELTRELERGWYGRGDMKEADFRAAETLCAAIRTAPLRDRTAASGESARGTVAAGAT